MRKTVVALLVAVGVALGSTAGDAAAADKKRHVSVKKNVKVKATAKRPVVRPVARRAATLDDAQNLMLQSASALVADQATGTVLFEKNSDAVVPIASITKLMTAMVALDAAPSLTEMLTIAEDDVDTLKGTRSRLKVGASLSREDMLRLALMSSENRAA
jgi:D-alanyl-D-alanine endopeptidase (penicillin-binding protein 7)